MSGIGVVTGGAGGIGWAITCHLAAAGWNVVIFDRDVALGERRVDEGTGRAGSVTFRPLDIRDRDGVEREILWTTREFGRLDLLVNNAGVQAHGALESLSWEVWSTVIDVDLHGAFHCLQAAGREMLKAGSGSIVNIVSIAAERGAAGRAPYCVSKAGLVALTRTAAAEWAARGVRVNAVGPGYIDTHLLRDAVAEGRIDEAEILRRIPAGKVGSDEDIAAAVSFLASAEASYITGQVLFVDGGFLVDYGVAMRRSPEPTGP